MPTTLATTATFKRIPAVARPDCAVVAMGGEQGHNPRIRGSM